MSKPWLSAKTAGEAYHEAWMYSWRERNFRTPDEHRDAASICVIEWHEAQRVKVGAYYEVRAMRGCYNTLMRTCDSAPEARKFLKRKRYVDSCVIHVTRYRMKSKGAKR